MEGGKIHENHLRKHMACLFNGFWLMLMLSLHILINGILTIMTLRISQLTMKLT